MGDEATDEECLAALLESEGGAISSGETAACIEAAEDVDDHIFAANILMEQEELKEKCARVDKMIERSGQFTCELCADQWRERVDFYLENPKWEPRSSPCQHNVSPPEFPPSGVCSKPSTSYERPDSSPEVGLVEKKRRERAEKVMLLDMKPSSSSSSDEEEYDLFTVIGGKRKLPVYGPPTWEESNQKMLRYSTETGILPDVKDYII